MLTEAATIALARAHAERVLAALERRYEADPRFRFDARAADRACEFFPKFLCHSKGDSAGAPFVLEDWQRRLTRLVFGTRWKSTGLRVVRTVYLFIARKNGKSTFAAGLALLMLVGDGEVGAEVYSAAADKLQAAIVFEEAAKMRAASADLSAATEAFRHAIICPKLQATYQVLSADASTKHGKNPSAYVIDELHAQPNRDLYDVLHTAVGARKQPLEVLMTTAGTDRHSIAWEIHDRARHVLAGRIEDPGFLPVLFCAGEDDDWTDPAAWAKANPSLGVAIRFDYLAGACKEASEQPGFQNTFRRLHLNQWTEQSSRAIDMGDWDASAGPIAWADMETAMAGRRCVKGLDLSTTTDLTCDMNLFPPDDPAGIWHCAPRFFVPEANMARRASRDGVPYPVWHREGALRATPGNVVDQDALRESVNEAAGLFRVEDVGYDPWNAAYLATRLQDDGVPMVEVRQGVASLGEATKFLLGLVASKRLAHGGHPVLRWMASNLAVRQDSNGNLKPDKESSGDRIDGIAALVTALARALAIADGGRSVYETMSAITAVELGLDPDPAATVPIGTAPADPAPDDTAIDWDVLQDVRHPRFAAMKARWEAHEAATADDEV